MAEQVRALEPTVPVAAGFITLSVFIVRLRFVRLFLRTAAVVVPETFGRFY